MSLPSHLLPAVEPVVFVGSRTMSWVLGQIQVCTCMTQAQGELCVPASPSEPMAFPKWAQMPHRLHALSNRSSAQWDGLGSWLQQHRAVLKQVGLFWNYKGLRAVFILSSKCPGFTEVCSRERILLLIGFGSRAVRKAALLRYNWHI